MKTHNIDLPSEFRSGNSIPVERATFTRERMQEVLEAYADARVREVQQWISVEDRLPETNRGISGWARVLAYWTTSDPDYEPGGIETSFFDGRNWQGANGDMDYHGARRVTHWMPLPEPPTE